MIRSIVLAALVMTAPLVTGQTAFEVASVRMSPPGSNRFTSISPAGTGRFTATDVTLHTLIALAFGVSSNQISGGPNWLDSEEYDVSAKPEGDGALSTEELRPLLRQLIEQRFKLATHREMKDSQGYALVVAKGGAKLQASKGGKGNSYILRGGLRLQNMTVKTLAAMLSRPVGRPVVDTTRIEGNYDITLEYAPDGAAESPLPSIFTALQEQLGLRLVAQRVPVEMVVIDRVERIPTEN
jgi:uncharacterized protein (TIGR03435 family)